MKTRLRILLCWIVTVASSQRLIAQGSFQDLDFESASVSQSESGQDVPVAQALPGWTVYLGTTEQSQVLFNNYSLGSASVDLVGPNPPTSVHALDGNYSVVLQSAVNNPQLESASIEQSGLIPADAQSLELKAWSSGAYDFDVSINGTMLAMTPLSSGPNFTLYGANIGAFAGQIGLLDISAPGPGGSFIEFDDISFSTSTVPEPSSVILTALGGLALVGYPRFARKR